MDAAKLQGKIYAGYAKAALRIGYTSDQYRPTTASNPLDPINKVTSFPASFNAEDMKYGKPRGYAKAVWYGLFDGRLTQVGDYLTNPNDGTFFIAAQQQALPILMVKCNRTITVYRPAGTTGSVGQQPYGGNTDANETAIMTGWPCSLLQGTKGEKSDVNLPGDARSPWWAILLPKFASVQIKSYDVVTDDLENRYIISSAELTDLGWRITASLAVP